MSVVPFLNEILDEPLLVVVLIKLSSALREDIKVHLQQLFICNRFATVPGGPTKTVYRLRFMK